MLNDAPKNDKDLESILTNEIYLSLGGGMVDVELDPEHYQLAIKKAFDRFRQRSNLSVEESYLFIELQPEQTEYYLPKEVKEVRRMFRRGVGSTTSGGGTYFDPFAAAYTNMYLVDAGRAGGLATFDFFHQHMEVMGRLFGADMNFTWDHVSSKLTIIRRMLYPESAVLWVYNDRPNFVIWQDDYARPWIRDYALAQAKFQLGEARSKFSQLAGPQGGTTLNGDALKNEALQDMERLEQEIINHIASDPGYGVVIG